MSALNKFIADRYSSNHSVSEYHVYEFFKVSHGDCFSNSMFSVIGNLEFALTIIKQLACSFRGQFY